MEFVNKNTDKTVSAIQEVFDFNSLFNTQLTEEYMMSEDRREDHFMKTYIGFIQEANHFF